MTAPRRIGRAIGYLGGLAVRCWRAIACLSGALGIVWGVEQWSRPAAACVAGGLALLTGLAKPAYLALTRKAV